MKGWDSIDYIKQMDRVIDILRNVTQYRDSKIQNVVSEQTVVDKEVNIEKLELTPSEEVPEVHLVLLVELSSIWAFDHQDIVCHFYRHFINI